jgi:hypothetical protein
MNETTIRNLIGELETTLNEKVKFYEKKVKLQEKIKDIESSTRKYIIFNEEYKNQNQRDAQFLVILKENEEYQKAKQQFNNVLFKIMELDNKVETIKYHIKLDMVLLENK